MVENANTKQKQTRLYVLFAIVVLGTALGNLSQTAVNSMLGSIDADFGIDASLGQWLATSYMLVVGITVPAVTFISRRLTTRALVFVAFLFLLVGSALDLFAATDSFWLMVVGRILQAISAGITMPLVQAIATVRFPAGQRATAMGIAGIALGFAPNIGPVLGGVMTDAWGWRSFFALLAILTLVLTAATFIGIERDSKGSNNDEGATLDVSSLIYSTLGFGGLLLAISNASSINPTSPMFWAPAIVGILFIILFFRRQAVAPQPLVSLDIFRHTPFVNGMLVQCTLMVSYLGITLLLSMYWQDLCGGSATESGLIFIPATIAALVLNPLAGIATDRYGVRPVALIGGASMAIGAIGAVFMDAATPLWLVALIQLVRGAGMSMIMGPTMSYSLAHLPQKIIMDGSSFIVLIRQACASLGTAAMVLLVSVLAPLAATGAIGAALPYQAAFLFSALFAVVMWIIIAAHIK